MQAVPVTTNVVKSNPVQGEVYSIKHYLIKFVSGFLRVLRFPPQIKLTVMIIISSAIVIESVDMMCFSAFIVVFSFHWTNFDVLQDTLM
jgi:hypothetical protein